jgi:hypothetical protein
MIDLGINVNNGEFLFNSSGDLNTIDYEDERIYQDISILLNIDLGWNKQFPKLGIGLLKEKNGNSNQLTGEVLRQSKLINAKVSRAYIDGEQNLQIII